MKFIQPVASRELRRSMSRRGNCWNNAPQESFFGHMKDEPAKLPPDEYYRCITTGEYP